MQDLVQQAALTRTRLTHQTHEPHRLFNAGDYAQRLLVYLDLAIVEDAQQLDGSALGSLLLLGLALLGVVGLGLGEFLSEVVLARS